MQLKMRVLAGGALVAVIAAAGLAQADAQAQPHGQVQPYAAYGYGCPGMGMMGPGMMGPGMMGRGMMGHGMMTGPGYAPQAALNLSVNDVRAHLERWVAMNGNTRLKVGAVTQRDASTIVGDIVTSDKDALVQRYAFDRNTGAMTAVQ